MPASHNVSVAWQIVALFVPIVNFWAFYRIRKLRKYMLYVFVPSIATSIALVWYISDTGLWVSQDTAIPLTPFVVASYAISWALFGFAIYLVIIWSREHNQNFDAPPSQS
ncbi:MAG: hypothetical protein MN733_04360 [Nitrososphaera sp.]|nr:hypothetical protein [Nitrososphaera sp.]